MQKILQDVNFGSNIQKIRLSKNLSQTDVVRQLHLHGRSMSASQYGHIEQGRKNIFVTDLVLLQRIFQVDYKEFFEGLVP
jgi:transcriptional regulator with XRE-family HTH domain